MNLTNWIVELRMQISDALRRIRSDRDITQEAVAEHLGLTTPGYSKIELGKVKLSMEKAIKLADYFNVSLDELVGRKLKKKKGLSELNEPGEKYQSGKNTIIIIGGEGKNSPKVEKWLKRLGRDLLDSSQEDDDQ